MLTRRVSMESPGVTLIRGGSSAGMISAALHARENASMPPRKRHGRLGPIGKAGISRAVRQPAEAGAPMSRDLRDCCNPLLNPARTLTRSETETQRRFTFPSRLATKTGNSYDLTYSIEHDPQSLGDWCNGSTTDSGSVSLGSNPRSPACNSLLLNMLCKLTLSSWQHLRTGVGVALLVLKALIAKQLPFAKPPGGAVQGSRCPRA